MKLLFKKQDLSIVPRWTDNIKDEWINPFITESCEVSFRDSISTTLYDAMANAIQLILSGSQGSEWDIDEPYNTNDIVLFEDLYYVALSPILAEEAAPNLNANWQSNDLINFWAQLVKPYLVYECYKSFILWHGKHVSQGGFRKHVDNTSFEINEAELSYLIGDLKNKISLKKVAMTNYLNACDYTIMGVKYSVNENVKQNGVGSIKIFAV
jgi:hypothetical protein